jgi:hypothetical protein
MDMWDSFTWGFLKWDYARLRYLFTFSVGF